MATKTLVALADNLLTQQPIESAAAQLGYMVEFALPAEDVVAYLVQRQPWLVIVDLSTTSIDWQRFIVAAKTSPATRKIPALAFGPHMDVDAIVQARRAGCDAVLSNSAFLADVAGAIAKYARADDSAELLQQAHASLPEQGHAGIEQFNQHEFFEQHETFEALWRAEPGPIRQLYQGILQVGVAYLQIQRQNYAGARKLFQRAWQYLNALPDVAQGIDVAQLRADAQVAQAELERLGPERIGEFPEALFKPVRYADTEHRPSSLGVT